MTQMGGELSGPYCSVGATDGSWWWGSLLSVSSLLVSSPGPSGEIHIHGYVHGSGDTQQVSNKTNRHEHGKGL